MLLTNRSEIWR